MTVTTRFAPSPTGRLHVGNLRTALHNWLLARRAGGRFLLRIDDTDRERSREGHVAAIAADLAWLGLLPDGVARQSERFALYEARFADLVATGRLYRCYETQAELDLKRKVQLGRGLPPIYDRSALALDAGQRAALEADGRQPHWRFRLDHDAPIAWADGIRGEQRFDPAKLSDPIVRREDGSWLYLLPSVIDDIEMAITHVVRGEDHVTNTALQLQMFVALGALPPAIAHEALLTSAEGKLSKRLGATDIDAFRAAGIEPAALMALLARIGTSMAVEPVTSPEPLIATFDLAGFGRAPARFDEAELAQLNARTIHLMAFGEVAGRLPAGMDEAAWLAIRPNLATIAEARAWWGVVTGPLEEAGSDEGDRAFLAQAAETAAEIEWGGDPWHALTGALKGPSGRKGRALFLPLRRALTGRDHGPDMAALLPLIGRDRALDRLRRAAGG